MARRVAAHSGFCERFRVPNECRDLALLVSDLHTHIHIAFELKPATLLKVFDKADAWRRPERFAQLLDACRADFHGRTGFEEKVYSQPDYVARHWRRRRLCRSRR
jgi:tRNA nucleotidyltransferase (CCA-adding enzyme)